MFGRFGVVSLSARCLLLAGGVVRTGFLGGAVALTGCATTPDPATTTPVAVTTKVFRVSPVVSAKTEILSPDELRKISDPHVGAPYVLGPDDVVLISVYLHPELSTTSASTPNTDNSNVSSNGSSGVLVTSDGTVQLPLIGSVKLGGLTLAEAESKLTDEYSQYVNDPRVSIDLERAASMRYYMLGAFAQPGVKYPNHALTLLEALALGGSVDIPHADLYQAYVAQGDVKLPVDLYALMIQGDLSQDIRLASGDVIVIPTNDNENAFVFGAVTKPGAVPFYAGGLSLLQALSEAGMDLPALTNAQLSRVHIIRAGGRAAEFFVVNASMIMNGQAGTFDLRPGDIVFVPPTAVATWNQVLAQLLPTLQTISGVLNPFVQITYLSRHIN